MASIRRKALSLLFFGLHFLLATAEDLYVEGEAVYVKDKDSKDSKDDEFAIKPVEKLDTEAYLGTWFQTYASASVIYTFELGANCVTATYTPSSDDTKIKVQNKIRPFAEAVSEDDGSSWWGDTLRDLSILEVRGFAAQSNVTDGAFQVELQPGPLPLGIGTPRIEDVEFKYDGNYWILELGPIEYSQYRWAIVTEGKEQTQLYVLVRNVEEFEMLYEEEVLYKLHQYGFTTFTNRPRKTNQKDCGYELEDLGVIDPETYEEDGKHL